MDDGVVEFRVLLSKLAIMKREVKVEEILDVLSPPPASKQQIVD